ncbi:hypothetical protein V6N11_057673 [Hibiscus sabdariffa]|uniref:Uncharacterized protein n=1 Tax=Hibiscus sabdariffa TaxID=183260 RepID=A0ABR2NI43_9ROSI
MTLAFGLLDSAVAGHGAMGAYGWLLGRRNASTISVSMIVAVERRKLRTDARIPAKKIDLEYASWLGQNQRQAEEEKERWKKAQRKRERLSGADMRFLPIVPPWIMTSSVTNQGRDEILLHMVQNYWLKH